VARDGAQPLAGAALGYGFGGNFNQGLLVVYGQAGTRSAMMFGSIEYNHNFRTADKPLGLRVRVDAGAALFYAIPPNVSDSAGVLGAVPGVWWMPLHTGRSAHRFVLALEPRIGFRTPIRTETNVSPYGDLNLVFEYDWVPCTMFGGGSCNDDENRPRP
jgi:hypothetical protein